jgi:hypothetical protein
MGGWRGLSVSFCFLLTFCVGSAAVSQPRGRLIAAELRSTSFAENKIGVSPLRKLTVYLPPGYTNEGKRFPVLYYLNHFFEDQTEPFADSRGVVGDGVGGYGAIRFGMRHPEVFGSVYGMQLVGAGANIQTTHSRPNWERLARARSLDDLGDDGFSRIFTSIYQAALPNPSRPPLFFDPPARSLDGRVVVDTAVMARFQDHFSLAAQLPSHAENLKTLRGLKFDWGRADPIVDHVYGSQAFAHLLDEYGVPHEAEEHGGGFRDRHWGEQGRVYTDVLPFFARHLVFDGASR